MKEIVVNEENQEVGVEGKKVKLRYDIYLFFIFKYHMSYVSMYHNLNLKGPQIKNLKTHLASKLIKRF